VTFADICWPGTKTSKIRCPPTTGLGYGAKMRKTGIKTSQRTKSLERCDRADHNFAVTAIGLVIFLLVTGFGAWLLGSPSTTALSPSPTASQAEKTRS
jgi:hypothetical protein